MKVVSYSHARNALKSVLDGVVQDADVTIISRRDAEGDAVVMSLDSYNSIMETLYPVSYTHLDVYKRQLRLSAPSCLGASSPSQRASMR